MDNEIKFIDLLPILLRRWWLIVGCALLCGAIALTYTHFFMEELFVSKGLLYVNSSSSKETTANLTLSNITTSQKLVSTYIEIINSDTFMDKVSERSNTGYAPDRIRHMVSMSAKNETEILEVRVASTSRENAQAIANTILFSANEEITRVVKGGSVEVVDSATLPSSPSSPNARNNILIGIMLGGALGVLIVFVVEVLDKRVKNQDDLAVKYDLPVLGLIPSLKV
ncbi:MAG: Capsular polysaccharide type 8 biosynthesis protein cap8A [Firmicutes bacterium ADurb.Bin193]|nr:MAG: Capsular polysaccharide type 8 biosynthesis protein cap8A [Firmicutes bacterium ADurb.Bin193]